MRLKPNRLSEPLLQYLRANLIFSFKEELKKNEAVKNSKERIDRLLVSAPVDIDFELQVINTAIELISGLLRAKFATTIEQDREILQKQDVPWRLYLAVTHRLNQKEIL